MKKVYMKPMMNMVKVHTAQMIMSSFLNYLKITFLPFTI